MESPGAFRGRTAPAQRSRRPLRPLPRIEGTLLLPAAVIAACALAALLAGDHRVILLPILVMLICTAAYAAVLSRRDRVLPLFEPASFAVAATFVYGVFPLVNFIAGGLRWTQFSDNRLVLLAEDPRDVAAFGWRYALYLAAFILTYLVVRGHSGVRTTAMQTPSRTTTLAIILTAIVSWGLLAGVAQVYGIDYTANYAELNAGSGRTIANLPLFVAQVTQNVSSIQLLLSQIIVALLMLQWRRHFSARLALIAFLLFVGANVVATRGPRSQLILLFMATALFYHRLVKPLKLLTVSAAGCFLLAAFVLLGIVRDLGGFSEAQGDGQVTLLTAGNEFQAILGTPFDLRERLHAGLIPHVPWQLYWADLLALVPSQLLPFEKIDPSLWYLKVAGIDNGGFVFGVMAQAIIGYDCVELAIRGVALALVLALVQRWYVRHVESFWPTMLHMYLAVWMYYTIRQSTFSFLYVVVYRFLPAVLVVEVFRFVLTLAPHRVREAAIASIDVPAPPSSL